MPFYSRLAVYKSLRFRFDAAGDHDLLLTELNDPLLTESGVALEIE